MTVDRQIVMGKCVVLAVKARGAAMHLAGGGREWAVVVDPYIAFKTKPDERRS